MSQASFESVLGADSPAVSRLQEFELGEEANQKLFEYCMLLQAFNEHTNLVSNASLEVVLKEHVLDSLSLLALAGLSLKNAELIDIGSGAGFPGMVIAIASPSAKVVLLESIGKKCRFLEDTAEKLGLKRRVEVCCARAETVGHDPDYRQTFDLATARAVGALPVVAELTLPFLKVGGVLLAQRSKRQIDLEEPDADAYFARLGGKLVDTIHLPPDLLGRELAVLKVRKEKATASRYPRTASQIKEGK